MHGRVPALIKLKYELMAQSPFGYFRGAAPVMAADLAVLPYTGICRQLCGDAHVRNLGAYAAPDGRLVFDINDFDETIRGPFEWDLKRMAASLVLAGRESRPQGGSARRPWQCIERYCAQMRAFAKMPQLEVSRFQVHRLGAIEPVHAALTEGRARHAAARAGTAYRAGALQRTGARRRFKEVETHADARHRRPGRGRAGFARTLPRDAGAAAATSSLVLPPRRCGLQGGRHRLGGPARLLHLL